MSRSSSWCVLVLVVGCDSAKPIAQPVAKGSGSPLLVDRCITLDAEPNGIWWQASSGSLLVTDDRGNRIARWRDNEPLTTVAALPPAPNGGGGLGQLVELPDGSLVVPRFGFGKAGDVVVVSPRGDARAVTGLDPARRRIGAASDAKGVVYVAGFTADGDQRVGGVWRLDLAAGTETVVITTLEKPVGLLVVGETLYVSDQRRDEIIAAPLPTLSTSTVVAKPPAVDLLAAGPHGSLFTGGKAGELSLISSAGAVSTIARDLHQIRGVAYDDVHHRVFAIDHIPAKAPGGPLSRLCAYAVPAGR